MVGNGCLTGTTEIFEILVRIMTPGGFMVKNYISISENTKLSTSCICCEIQYEIPKLWDVQFTFGSHVEIVKLCEMHLKSLKNEIDFALFESSRNA